MLPTADEPPGIPFTAQVTPVFGLPETVAVNGNEAPARMFAEVGATVTVTGGGGEGARGVFVSVTVLEAIAELEAALVAVTVTVAGLGSEVGAV